MGVERWLLVWFGVTVVILADTSLKQCKDQERLYHVIITDNQGSFHCGGSLISDSWILTDAYCYKWGIKVLLGGHPGPGRIYVIRDPPEILWDNNGVARLMLLKLPHPTKIKPVELPTQQVDLSDKTVDLAGYSLMTMDDNNQTDFRESVKLQCAQIKVSNSRRVIKKFLFFKSEDGTLDIAWKDSGGAMIYKNKIYGVMMNATFTNHSAPYLQVFENFHWINQTINQ